MLPAASRYANITLLRACAALLVVYDHLFAMGPERYFGSVPALVAAIRAWLTGPLGIIQDAGWFAVVLFFLISGFIITHAGLRETRQQFLVRRVLRVYPPLIVAIVLAGLAAWWTGNQVHTAGEYLLSFTLLNYLTVPLAVPLGVGWTLIIEVLFYAATAILLGQLKARPGLAAWLQIAAIAAVLALARRFGDNFFLFAASAAYLPYLVMGQVLYLVHARKIGAAHGALLTAAAYGCVHAGLASIHTAFLPLSNSYPLSFAYAYLLFCIALLLRERLALPRWIEKTADMSYSIYLLHGVVGLSVLQMLAQRWPLPGAIALACALSLLAAWISYRWVETPAIALARRLSGPRRHAPDEVVKAAETA